MSKINETVGKKFNRLTVVSYVRGGNRIMYKCICECGKEKMIEGYHLRSGSIKSCGCYQSERASEVNYRNGGSINYIRLPEYTTWCSIKDRCCNTKNKSYIHYGGRGITISPLWINNFSKFLKDMGKRPGDGYSIERKDVNKGYFPDNCEWIKTGKQARNKSTSHVIIIDNVKYDLKTLSEISGLDWGCLYYFLIQKTKQYDRRKDGK